MNISGAVIAGALTVTAALTAAPAQADPLPDFCGSGDICEARLSSVTTDVVDGTVTGTPVGGGAPLTLAGPGDAYLKSTGFGELPEPVRSWDTTIDQIRPLDVSASDPNWYGNAKAQVFLPRTLNEFATQFPPDVLVVRFTASDAEAPLRLVSIQPTPVTPGQG